MDSCAPIQTPNACRRFLQPEIWRRLTFEDEEQSGAELLICVYLAEFVIYVTRKQSYRTDVAWLGMFLGKFG
jgi:hypothetical protein